eukprot:GHUV01049098.1.p1 GENE.GHUV01049098.1~~GHUV01049098.1.p1  ORF type:complete len:115 (-),score=32.16 GHUV01049098.1:114-458(-)
MDVVLCRASFKSMYVLNQGIALAPMSGGIGSSEPPANPSTWLTDKLWGELVRLSSDVHGFEGLEASFREDQAGFKVTQTYCIGRCCSNMPQAICEVVLACYLWHVECSAAVPAA